MNTNDTLSLVRNALAKANAGANLAKSWTQSPNATTGLTAYSLEAPAKTLTPLITPLRNELARSTGGMGIQANWRAVTKINNASISGGVSEGNRGGVIGTTVKEYLAAFRTIGVEDNVTWEADLAAQGFDDVKARAVQGTLHALMEIEEKLIVGGNGSVSLGQPATPVLVASTQGGAIAATTPVHVRAVALTMDGYLAASGGTVLAQVTRANADGSTDTYNGGASQASAAANVTTGTGGTNSVAASVQAVIGAVGYAWFVGDAGTQRLYGTTTTNSVVITHLAAGGQTLPADLVTNDRSANLMVFDGFLALAAKPGSGAYWKALPTGTAGLGSTLTADGAGGIEQLDEMLEWYWTQHRISPTEIWVSAREANTLRKKALAGVQNGTHRFSFNAQQGMITAGSMLRGYLNQYSMSGAQDIPIRLHPNLPPGTILVLTHELPYRLSGVDKVNRILCRKDYHQTEWPMRSRKYEYGVYSDQVLQCYFPPGIGVISNIAGG